MLLSVATGIVLSLRVQDEEQRLAAIEGEKQSKAQWKANKDRLGKLVPPEDPDPNSTEGKTRRQFEDERAPTFADSADEEKALQRKIADDAQKVIDKIEREGPALQSWQVAPDSLAQINNADGQSLVADAVRRYQGDLPECEP